MKKRYLFIVVFLSFLILIGCDYDEKSFQVLGDGSNEIPSEVTTDFTLPKGHYGEFVWSSSEEAIIRVEGNEAFVTQQLETIEVIITATIKNMSKDFHITVLKTGSPPALFERAKQVRDTFTLPETIEHPVILKTEENAVFIHYHNARIWRNDYTLIETADGATWLVPNKHVLEPTQSDINVSFGGINGKGDTISIGQSNRHEFIIDIDNTHPLQHIFNVYNTLVVSYEDDDYNYRISQSFDLPVSSYLDDIAHIEWTSENEDVIEISSNGTQAIVHNPVYTTTFNLIISITTDSTTIDILYPVLVIPIN